MSSGSGSQTIGYRYYAGMHMALCHGPIDKITKIKVDDAMLWEGTLSSGNLTVDEPELFGGDSREGGISGTLSLLKGTPTQGINSYLASVLSDPVPAFRRIASVVLQHMYLTNNPYMKPWKFFGQRIHLQSDNTTQWQDALAEITVTVTDEEGADVSIASMNPAHIIRECLVDPMWGMGYDEADLDLDTFVACAQTLYDEGFGLCVLWDTQGTVEDFINMILQHIDGTLYIDRATGKYSLQLIRDDYDINDLIVLDESNIEHMSDQKQMTFGELTNTVSVTYHNVLTNENASATVQDIALIQQQGSEISTSITYEGIVDPVNASKVAQRDLKTLSYPLFSCTIYTTSIARNLHAGSVFVLSWNKLFIDSMVMRVTEIAYGDGQNRVIRLKCVQDIFGFPETAYLPRPATGWQNPNVPPGAARYTIAFEVPYYGLILKTSQSIVDAALATNDYIGHVGAAAVRNNTGGAALNASVSTDSGAGYATAVTIDFSPGGQLNAGITETDITFTLKNYTDTSEITVNTWVQIDDELMIVDSVAIPDVTVKRGALDTTPRPHLADAVVIFWQQDFGIDPVEYVSSDSVDVKIRPVNSSGAYPLASVTAETVALSHRAIRPFLPGQIAFDGDFFPPPEIFYGSSVTMSWVHRNRLLQTGGTQLGFLDDGIAVEAGTTYEIRLYDSDAVLVHTYSGITGNSQVLSAADYGSLPTPFLTVKLRSVRDGFYSFQEYEWTITVAQIEETESGLFIELEDGSGYLELEDGTSPGGGGGGGGGPLAIVATSAAVGGVLATHSEGDYLVCFAFRDGSTTPPTVPGDWTTLDSGGISSSSFVLAAKTAGPSESAVTFTNATGMIMVSISGDPTIAAGADINHSVYLGTGLTWPGITLDNTDGSSIGLSFAGHRSTNTTLETPPSFWTPLANFVDATNEVAAYYVMNPTSIPTTSRSVGGTTAGYAVVVMEVKH